MVDYEEAIKKPFTDLGKLVLGIILGIIPIINWIVQGFIIENSGVGKNRPSKKMPEWKDLGDYFVKGFLSYVIIFIYMIPALVVFIVAFGYAAASLTTAFVGILPEGFFRSMMTGQTTRAEISQILSQHWMLIMPTIITLAPLILLGLVLLIIAIYLSPMGILNWLKNKKFGKAFDLSVVARKAFTVDYLIAWVIVGVIAVIIKEVLFFLPWIGQSIAFFVSGIIAYTLFGQIYREKK